MFEDFLNEMIQNKWEMENKAIVVGDSVYKVSLFCYVVHSPVQVVTYSVETSNNIGVMTTEQHTHYKDAIECFNAIQDSEKEQ